MSPSCSQRVPDIPPAWKQVDLFRLGGIILVVGRPDVGKSTFAQYLYREICNLSPRVAYLDGDPGQSTLGPPATMTVATNIPGDQRFPPRGRYWRTFVGAVSPRGHMLPLITGAARLVAAARGAGAEVLIYDTTGLVDPAQGGLYLKLAKIDLLRPGTVVAFQRRLELEPLLAPMRRSRRLRVIELPSSSAAARRDISSRQAHRAAEFARYFINSRSLRVNWSRFAVLPRPRFFVHQLVALEDVNCFTLGLGIAEGIDPTARQVVLRTPLGSTREVDAIRLGDLAVDPESFRDRTLQPGA